MARDLEKIEQQRQLYGEPVGDLVRRVTGGLGLTQSAISRVLGLSPAMLSQLMSGHRVKIGNPRVVARLQAMLTLAEEAPTLTRREVERRIEEIGESRVDLTTSQVTTDPAADPAALVRRVLHAVASGRELDLAARALDDVAPGLAEVIRVYGSGSAEEADRHLASITHLL